MKRIILPLAENATEETVRDNGRSCGTCTACCDIKGINELRKPVFSRCEHLAPDGRSCAAYATRPAECRTYYCMWRAGVIDGDDRRRPDNLGVMFEATSEPVRYFGGHVLVAWETYRGAFDLDPVRTLLNRIAADHPIVCRYYGVRAGFLLRASRPQTPVIVHVRLNAAGEEIETFEIQIDNPLTFTRPPV